MPDLNRENSRRALAAASGSLRAAGIRRVWIEQGGERGAVFLVESERPGPNASDPPPEAVAALRQALAGLHAPRWQARDGTLVPDSPVAFRVSAPGAGGSLGADSIAWPPAEIAVALEHDLRRGEHGRRLSEELAELIQLEQGSGAGTGSMPP